MTRIKIYFFNWHLSKLKKFMVGCRKKSKVQRYAFMNLFRKWVLAIIGIVLLRLHLISFLQLEFLKVISSFLVYDSFLMANLIFFLISEILILRVPKLSLEFLKVEKTGAYVSGFFFSDYKWKNYVWIYISRPQFNRKLFFETWMQAFIF